MRTSNQNSQIEIDCILDCIKKGWVITPLKPNSKIPRYQWKNKDYQYTTEEQVLGHWLDYPNDNYGIITSLSGLKVVDVDSVKNKVEAKYIQEILEYPTYTVKTQSGGFHYYYQTDENKKDQLGAVIGIDIKADGYILGAGSQIDGREYIVVEDLDIKPIPSFSFIKKPVIAEVLPSKPLAPVIINETDVDKIIKSLAYISADDYSTWIKVGMGIKEAGLSIAIWEDWSRGSSKYEAGQCAKKWDGFQSSGVGIGSIMYLAQQNGFQLKDNTPKLKVGNMLKRQKPTEKVETVTDTTLPLKLVEQGDDLTWLGDGSRKYAYYETGIDWIDNNMHGLQKRTILTAPSNTGKTLLALQIAKSVSKSGRPVLYIDMEQPIKDLWIRVMTMGTKVTKEDFIIKGQNIINSEEYKNVFKYNKKDAENIYWTDLEAVSSLDELDIYIDKWAETQEFEPLIIIDQVSGLKQYTGKETMYEQTQAIADWLRYGLRDKPYTVLMLSPQNKAQNNKQSEISISGSGELAYAVDCVLVLSKVEENGEPWDRKRITMNIAKTRSGSIKEYDYHLTRNNRDEFQPIPSSISNLRK